MTQTHRRSRLALAGRALAALSLVLGASACSGGGSGSSGAPTYSYSVSVDPTRVELQATFRASPPPSQTITASYTGDGLVIGLPPGVASLPPWLSVDWSQGPGKTVSITLSVLRTDDAPGARSATLRLYTGRSDGAGEVHVDLPISYTLLDDLVVSPPSLALVANDGSVTRRRIEATLASNGSAVAWTATSDPGLELSAAAGAAGTPVEVAYDAMAQVLPAGAGTLSVRLSTVISGATVTRVVPVEVDVGPHRIYAARNGVALASLPGVSRIASTVPLVDYAGVTTGAWSASSHQPWLVVDGIQDDALALHADVDGLADGLYVGTVTVASSGPRVEGDDLVWVGLYVSSVAPVNGLLATGAGQAPVPDPLRPWVWIIEPGDRSQVAAYNVYSGAVERVLSLPAPVVSVAVSGDGQILYGGGMAAANGYTDIARVRIDDGEALPAFAGHGDLVAATLRPGGREFVATGDRTFYDAATGVATSGRAAFSLPYGWYFAVSGDQRFVWGVSNGFSPRTLVRTNVRLSGAASALSFADTLASQPLDTAAFNHFVASATGASACVPGGAGKPFEIFGPSGSGGLASLGTFTGSTSSDPTIGIALAPDGRVLVVSGTTIDSYDALLGTRTTSRALPASASPWSIRFSADGERAVVAGFADGSTQALWAYPSE